MALYCSCEVVSVTLLFMLGLSLLIPGTLMRLEHSNSPTPFVALNLCKGGSNTFVTHDKPCVKDVFVSSVVQTLQLSGVTLTNGVSYVPSLVRDNFQGIGSTISCQLLDKSGIRLFNFTARTDPLQNNPSAGILDFPNVILANSSIQMFRPSSVNLLQNPMCENTLYGCKTKVPFPLSRIYLSNLGFSINGPTNPFSQFTTDITLSCSATVTSTVVPQIYISFEQLTLSSLQTRGVVYLIVGILIILLSTGLTIFYSFFQRRSDITEHED